MDINLVKSVTVTLKNGDEFLYKERGLEKFRKQMIKSPPLVKKKKVKVIETDDNSENEDDSYEEIASSAEKEVETNILSGNGYQTTSFNYSTLGKDESPYEAAKRMAAGSGLSFGS